MKKMMLKRVGAMMLCGALMLGLIGCGQVTPGQNDTQQVQVDATAVVDASKENTETQPADTSTDASAEQTTEATQDTVAETPAQEETAVKEPVSYEPGEIADNSVDFVKNMKLGWNLGNTLDATDGSGLSSETSWGMTETTRDIIFYVRESGFTTIRIPTSWHNHMKDGVIDEEWMDRVQQVVDWALEAGLYVVLNSHHDNMAYYPTDEKMDASKEFLTQVWTQVAERFKDYDEHLVFESMNEPRLQNTGKEWWFADNDDEGIECIKNVCELNQVFVDVIRSSGGYNETRFLMVPSAIASPDYALNSNFTMPTDTIENHLMLSVHAYTPYDFTMNDNGYSNWNSTKSSELNFMGLLNSRFAKKGYGVVIGEFGATNKDNLSDRVMWADMYCGRASAFGMSCILWDNGQTAIGNENFGMINRKELSIYYPEILNAMLNAYK